MAEPRWLLLAHQLPTRPSNARVKTWRRLQQLGAVPTRNSVYVLPNTEQCREDFEWMRTEIVALGGEATVFAGDVLSPGGSDGIVALFHRAREADYRALKKEVDRLLAAVRRRRGTGLGALPSSRARKGSRPPSASGQDSFNRERATRAIRGLRERLAETEKIDFFGAPGRQRVADALATLERIVVERDESRGAVEPLCLSTAAYQSRRWVTRPRPGVDRMASAWLIRRYIDPNAAFGFADRAADFDVPFDMYDGQFSHRGSLCTFETLAQTFAIVHPTVVRIGQIVHDLDMKETRYAPPEAPAITRMVDGLRQLHADDQALLEQGIAMFEALARSFDAAAEATPSRRGVRAGRRSGRRSGGRAAG
jgi:hypothetical protein